MIVLLLVVVVPIVELYTFVQVANAIGFFNALGLLVVVSILGGWLAKHQGRRAWARFNEQIAARRTPSKEVVDGVLILVAGVLLFLPGFVTGAFGLLLLLPPVRALVRALIVPRITATSTVIRYGTTRFGGTIVDATSRDPSDSAKPPTSRGELER